MKKGRSVAECFVQPSCSISLVKERNGICWAWLKVVNCMAFYFVRVSLHALWQSAAPALAFMISTCSVRAIRSLDVTGLKHVTWVKQLLVVLSVDTTTIQWLFQEMTLKEFTALKSATSGDNTGKLRHFVTTVTSCERGTPLFTVAIINQVTQGQEIFFLFSKMLKPPPAST